MFYIKKTEDAKDLPLPKFMSESAAGMDLFANINDDVIMKNGDIKLIKTGVQISIPKGYEAQVRARSGYALKNGIALVNGIGTIDADYRGEIGVIIINLGNDDFKITRGMRIAQLVINKVEIVDFYEVKELDETDRGAGGFGHTN
ncbi:MAG: dUTP diphosphatase [Lachnospirales bacterium]